MSRDKEAMINLLYCIVLKELMRDLLYRVKEVIGDLL